MSTKKEALRERIAILTHKFKTQKLAPVEKLAKDYSIANVSALCDLYDEINLQTAWLSVASLDPKDWRLPRDYKTDWKTTKEQLRKISQRLDKLDEELSSMLENPTASLALQGLDRKGRLPDLFCGVSELKLIFAKAIEIDGRKGNRPIEDWKISAAQKAQRFWKENMPSSASPYLNPEKKPENMGEPDEYGNAFTNWLFDFLNLIGNNDVSRNEFGTIVKNAYQSIEKNSDR